VDGQQRDDVRPSPIQGLRELTCGPFSGLASSTQVQGPRVVFVMCSSIVYSCYIPLTLAWCRCNRDTVPAATPIDAPRSQPHLQSGEEGQRGALRNALSPIQGAAHSQARTIRSGGDFDCICFTQKGNINHENLREVVVLGRKCWHGSTLFLARSLELRLLESSSKSWGYRLRMKSVAIHKAQRS
jgi:hypothetical protein